MSSVRQRRLESGLTQAELAARAGVSRQLVAAVEAGANAPAVDAAIRLARALECTVEELFACPAPPVLPALGGTLRDRVPLRVGRVGEQLVAAELADHGVAGASWAKPDAVLDGGALRLFERAVPAGMVLAGCDPAIGVADAMLHGLGARSLLAISASSGAALEALAAGRVHAAVVHGPASRLPKPPVRVARVHLARWQVGIGLRGKPGPTSVEALVQGGIAIAQRDPAAASQQALERALTEAGVTERPAGPRAAGHIDAARIAATLGCAAVTTEAAASAFELRFIALEQHTVEVWLADRWLDQPAAKALGELLASAAFTERIAQFGGYELSGCGSRVQ